MWGIFRLNMVVLASRVRGYSMELMSSLFVFWWGGEGALSNNAFRSS